MIPLSFSRIYPTMLSVYTCRTQWQTWTPPRRARSWRMPPERWGRTPSWTSVDSSLAHWWYSWSASGQWSLHWWLLTTTLPLVWSLDCGLVRGQWLTGYNDTESHIWSTTREQHQLHGQRQNRINTVKTHILSLTVSHYVTMQCHSVTVSQPDNPS